VDSKAIAALLAETELFSELDEDNRLAIAEQAGRRIIDKGQVIYWQDEPGESMFVLLEGAVRLVIRSRDGQLVELGRHYAPAVFGELTPLDGGPRSDSAEAVEHSILLVITRQELQPLLDSNQQVTEALLRLLGANVRRNIDQVRDLAFLSIRGRVAAKLLELADRPAGPGMARTRRVTQVELAAMVGGTRISVNHAIKWLEAHGYIRSVGHTFEIRDPEQLRRLAAD
jgi:CRP-like cAMP-binding protein